MVDARTVDIKDLFADLQDRMLVNLVGDRKIIDHPTAKGAASEVNWRKMLSDHLPKRYQVDTGFLLDHEGSISEQIDVVVFDRQYTPFLLNRDGVLFIPAEGAYAVFEVRQDFNKDNLKYASEKVASVRRLKRTSFQITHAGGHFPPREPIHILGGVLTLDSGWSPPFGNSFTQLIRGLNVDSRIDLACVLNHGTVAVLYDGQPRIAVSPPNCTLIFFLIRLLARLQSVGTVPAIDLDAYAKWLGD